MHSFSFRRLGLLSVLALGMLSGLGGCSDDEKTAFQGYGEGEFINVSAPVSGRLETLAVERGMSVNAGAALFVLESEPEAAAQRQAARQVEAAAAQLADLQTGKRPPEIAVIEAQLAQAIATEQYARRQLARDETLVKSDNTSRARFDDSKRAADTATALRAEMTAQIEVARLPGREEQIRALEAQLAAARASLDQAEWNLTQKKAFAPTAALVFDTLYRQGEWIAAGTPVVRLLPPANIKVRFFVPETVAGSLHPGQPVLIRCDGCESDIPATLSFISPQAEYTPPIIYSNETRSKLVFMIEARPAVAEASRIRPGQPVTVLLP